MKPLGLTRVISLNLTTKYETQQEEPAHHQYTSTVYIL